MGRPRQNLSGHVCPSKSPGAEKQQVNEHLVVGEPLLIVIPLAVHWEGDRAGQDAEGPVQAGHVNAHEVDALLVALVSNLDAPPVGTEPARLGRADALPPAGGRSPVHLP